MSFTQNLFGAIAGSQGNLIRPAPDFIPLNDSGQTLKITNTSASWLGLGSRQQQYWAYKYCSPLASVIDKIAMCDINGVLEALKANGSEDYSQSGTVKRVLNLLSRPNPLQTWEEFRAEQVAYKSFNGFCPVFPILPAGITDITYCKSIWNIPPWLATPQVNTDFNIYSIGGRPVKSWTLSIFGQPVDIPGDKIMMLTDGIVKDSSSQYMLPLSKVAGLDYAISNICYGMEADNVLLRKKGPLGVWTHKPTSDNIAGYLPMTKDMRDELQNDLQQYGLRFDQFQHLISRNSVAYESAGYNVRELMTKETVRQGIEMICDKFGVPAEVMSFKDVTYENRAASEKFMYQNNVIPNNNRDMRVYTIFFGLDKLDTPVKLQCDFTELPIMQEDAAKEGAALMSKTTAYQTQYKDGLLTKNQYRQRLGQDSIEGQDYYYMDSPEYKAGMLAAQKTKKNEKSDTAKSSGA